MDVQVVLQVSASAYDDKGNRFAWIVQAMPDTPIRVVESAAKHYLRSTYSATIDFSIESYLAKVEMTSGTEIERVEPETA